MALVGESELIEWTVRGDLEAAIDSSKTYGNRVKS